MVAATTKAATAKMKLIIGAQYLELLSEGHRDRRAVVLSAVAITTPTALDQCKAIASILVRIRHVVGSFASFQTLSLSTTSEGPVP